MWTPLITHAVGDKLHTCGLRSDAGYGLLNKRADTNPSLRHSEIRRQQELYYKTGDILSMREYVAKRALGVKSKEHNTTGYAMNRLTDGAEPGRHW
jgi:hypothetical protein